MASDKHQRTCGSKDITCGSNRKDSGSSELSNHEIRRSQVSTNLPDNLEFFWQINAITVNDCKSRFITLGNDKTNELAAYWFPPNRKEDFTRSSRSEIFRWKAGNSTVFKDFEKLEEYSIASVFIQAGQNNFVATDCDCMNENVKDREYGWSQIKFSWTESDNRGLSKVTYPYKSGEHFTLAVPAAGSTWMPQVLPEVYNRPRIGPKAYHGDVSSSSGLCGNLALLVAMAAFSVHESLATEAIVRCFGDHCWRGHRMEHGSQHPLITIFHPALLTISLGYDGRGVIVKIYVREAGFDKNVKHLNDFENGRYGAIFEFNPSARTQPVSNTSQRPAPIATPVRITTVSSGDIYGSMATPSAAQPGQYTRQISSTSPPTTSNYGLQYTRRLSAGPQYLVPHYSISQDPVPTDDYPSDAEDAGHGDTTLKN